jgi:uncharacterized protein (DUF2384 family)
MKSPKTSSKTIKPKKLKRTEDKVKHKVYSPPKSYKPSIFEEIFGLDFNTLRQFVLDDQEYPVIPAQPAFDHLSEYLGSDKQQTLKVLGWQRRKARFDQATLDRVLVLLKVYELAYRITGADATAWFQEPRKHLYGRTPLEVTQYSVGVDMLVNILWAIEDGNYL